MTTYTYDTALTQQYEAGNSTPGTLVTVEGIDGCGKSTIVSGLEKRAAVDGRPVSPTRLVTTAEPSDEWTGKQVYRAIATDPSSPDTSTPFVDFLLFMADRAQHIHSRVLPALEDGKLVVTDRYAQSTRVYQSEAIDGQFHNSKAQQSWVETVMHPWHVPADVIVYVDVPVDVAFERIGGEASDSYEERDNLVAVQRRYEAMLDDDPRTVRVDGTEAPRQVLDTIVDELEARHGG
jgi:dTMP kinase